MDDYTDPVYQIYPEYKDAPYATDDLVYAIKDIAQTNRIVPTGNHEAVYILDKDSELPVVEFASAYFVNHVAIAGVKVKHRYFRLLKGGQELYNIIKSRREEQETPKTPYIDHALADFVASNRIPHKKYWKKLADFACSNNVKFEKSEDPYYKGKASVFDAKTGEKCAVLYYDSCLCRYKLLSKLHGDKDCTEVVYIREIAEYIDLLNALKYRGYILKQQKLREKQAKTNNGRTK